MGFAFEVELLLMIMTLEIAAFKNIIYIWLESNSTFVVSVLTRKSKDVSGRFLARWLRTLKFISCVHFHVSHIYIEGNQTEDFMAYTNQSEGYWDCIVPRLLSFIASNLNGANFCREVY